MKNLHILIIFFVFAVIGVPQTLAVGSETASEHGDSAEGSNAVELPDDVFVMNGQKSYFRYFPHKAHSSKETKNIYPLSKEQLKAGLDQFDMESRMMQAANWNLALKKDVLKEHVSELPTLFESNRRLKTREEVIRASFEDAIRTFDADSTDLIEILVTTQNEEMEEKLDCKKLDGRWNGEIVGIYKEILKSLCQNQRDMSFNKNARDIKNDVNKINEYFKLGANKDDQKRLVDDIIKIFTTRNYSHLREMFSMETELREYISKANNGSNFHRVINYILINVLDGRPEFFAMLLHHKVEKLYKNHNNDDANHDVQRILSTRAQIDLADIVKAYDKEFASVGDLSKMEFKEDSDESKLVQTLKHIRFGADGFRKGRFTAYIEIIELVQGEKFLKTLAVGSETASEHGDSAEGSNPVEVELSDEEFVINGRESLFPHKAHSSRQTKNIYPLSKEQLKAGLDQFDMESRMMQAANWNLALKKDVLKKYISKLPTLFESNRRLKTREEVIHASFEDAIRTFDADSTDLIEILVTTQNEEMEEKLDCKKLDGKLNGEIVGIYKEILKSLCQNQRDMGFYINDKQVQRDIAKINEYLAGAKREDLVNAIINIFTTRNYSHLRKMFTTDMDSVLRANISKANDDPKFYRVINHILIDVLDGRPEFFAMLLHQKIVKLSTKHNNDDAHHDVQRILSTRAQIDLADIVKAYDGKYASVGNLSNIKFGESNKSKLVQTLIHIRFNAGDSLWKRYSAYIEIIELVVQGKKLEK